MGITVYGIVDLLKGDGGVSESLGFSGSLRGFRVQGPK